MSNRSWNKTAAPEASPNSTTWKERCEAAEAVIDEMAAKIEELESRLSEIASIAAPDQSDELAEISAKLDRLLEQSGERDPHPRDD